MANPTVDYVRFALWTLRDKAAQRRSPTRSAPTRYFTTMKKSLSFVCALICLSCATLSYAGSYQLSGRPQTTTWPNGGWDGYVSIPNLLCLNFPDPSTAQELTRASFNNHSVAVIRVIYKDDLVAAIGMSTRPPTRTAKDDIQRFIEHYRSEEKFAKESGLTFLVTVFDSPFGETIGLRLNNVISDTPETGPFPFERKLFKPSSGDLKSMSVHRFFERGPDRFEIGVLKVLRDPLPISSEAELSAKLTALADTIFGSFQKCTSGLPLRVLK